MSTMNCSSFICFLLLLASVSLAFDITGHSNDTQTLSPGDTLELKCKTDLKWEYCSWRHKDNNNATDMGRECHIEWKWVKAGRSLQHCHEELKDRVSITGNYQNNECGLLIEDTVEGDSGEWECEVEEYVLLGSKGSGSRVKHQFDVTVGEEDQEEEAAVEGSGESTSVEPERNMTDTDSDTTGFIENLVDDIIDEVVGVEETTTEAAEVTEATLSDDITATTDAFNEALTSDTLNETTTNDVFTDVTTVANSGDDEEVLIVDASEQGGLGVEAVVGIVLVVLVLVAGAVMVALRFFIRRKQFNEVNFERVEEEVVGDNDEFTFQGLKASERETSAGEEGKEDQQA